MEHADRRFPADTWSVDELESELRAARIIETKVTWDAIRQLSPAQRAMCGECLLLRRINRSRERVVRSLLEDAEDQLARCVRRVWLSCVESDLVAASSRRDCDAAQREVERLESEIRALAAECVGFEEEILDALRQAAGSRAVDVKTA